MRVPSLESIYLRQQSVRRGVDPMLESSGIRDVWTVANGQNYQAIRSLGTLFIRAVCAFLLRF